MAQPTTNIFILKIITGGDRYMLRYNADGTLDNTFGNNGITFDDSKVITDIIVQPDNKILVSADYEIFNLSAKRFLPGGAPDSSFGTDEMQF